MKDCEIFYFDMDGTLLDNVNDCVSKASIAALNDLKKQGKKIVVCTGRTVDDFNLIKEVQDIAWDAYILSNGGLILDENRQQIKSLSFSADWIRSFLSLSKATILLEGRDVIRVNAINEQFKESLAHFKNFNETVLLDYNDEDIYTVMLYDTADLSPVLHEHAQNNAHIFRDQMNNYEFVPLISGKDKAVSFLNQSLGIKSHCAFGDGENDILMLRGADVSIAMGNASKLVKQAASYVTDSVNQDGIAKALQYFGLIE